MINDNPMGEKGMGHIGDPRGPEPIKNESEMEEIEKMIFNKSIEVNDQIKGVVKSLSDVYKEFRKNGLSMTESIAMVNVMFGVLKGERR